MRKGLRGGHAAAMCTLYLSAKHLYEGGRAERHKVTYREKTSHMW